MKLLTNLLFEPRGKHDPALTYRIKDTVMSPDGSQVYFALQDVPAGTALDDTDYWMLQIDMYDVKTEMESAVANFGERAKAIGTRVKGETAKASGNPVTFLPDAGSLLMPVTVLEPQQEGSGDPSPENIRPFIGYDKLGLNHHGEDVENTLSTHVVQIDRTVYGLRYEWLTGKGVIEWAFKSFDGSETFGMSETGVVLYTPIQKPLRGSLGIGSHHSRVECGNSLNIHDALNATDLDTWTAFVTAQHAAGTPVQVLWPLATPIEIQLTPTIISAADPEQNNTLYGDGSIEVEYVKPLHVSIEERIAAALAAMQTE